MVAIPQNFDPTLMALQREVEKAQRGKEQRDYLGASQIGDPCARKIWYKFNKYPEEEVSAIGLMAADSGYYAEEITAKRLRAIPGINLITHKEDGTQYGWSAIDGKFKGHYDGIITGLIQAPKAKHIWEHKDKDHNKFADFQNKKKQYGEKRVLEKWDEKYFGQAQVNMHFEKVDRHYMTVSYAGARKYDSCRTEYQPEVAERYVDRAHKIIEATQPPPRINEAPDFFLCKFCSFRKICHDGR